MTTCETLTHGTCVFLSQRHRFGTDAMLLADFCRPRRAEFAADLCGGCGIVALRWHDEGHRGTCVSVELNGEAHGLLAAALAAQPEAAQHIKAVHADLRTYAPAQAGQFHLAACNPPYFTGGHASPDPARAAARHEETCAFEDAAACAARRALCGVPPPPAAGPGAGGPHRGPAGAQAPAICEAGPGRGPLAVFVRGPEEPPPRSDRSAGPSARPVPPLLSGVRLFCCVTRRGPFGVFRRGLSLLLCELLGEMGLLRYG